MEIVKRFIMNTKPNEKAHQLTNNKITRRRLLEKSSKLAAGTYALTVIGCGSADDQDSSTPLLKVEESQEEKRPAADRPVEAPDRLIVKMSDQLKKIGGSQEITDQGILKALGVKETILLVRANEDTVYANTINCTHKGARVEYNADQKVLICPLHGSRFKLTGEVAKGPAARPLVHFKATIDRHMVVLENL